MYLYSDSFTKFNLTCKECGSNKLEVHVDSYDTGGCPSCSWTEESIEIECMDCKAFERHE